MIAKANCRNAYPALNVRPASHFQPISLFHRVWPVACLAVGLNDYRGLEGPLGYGLFRLVF